MPATAPQGRTLLLPAVAPGFSRTLLRAQNQLASYLCLEPNTILHIKPKCLLCVLNIHRLFQACSCHTKRWEVVPCSVGTSPFTMAEPQSASDIGGYEPASVAVASDTCQYTRATGLVTDFGTSGGR